MVEAFPPQASYVERALERQQYQAFLSNDTAWVMLVTGLGGSGKSDFLFELAKYPPPDSYVALLDFAMPVLQEDALSILEELAFQIEPYCDAQYINTFKSALKDSRILLAGLTNTIIQEQYVGAYATPEPMQQHISIADYAQEKRQQIWAVVTAALYAQLDSFHLKRLIILLDNCEWITEPDSSKPESLAVGRWLMDMLIPGIHKRMQLKGRRCSVVIASSMPLSLHIHSSYQQQCNLDILDKVAVDSYLTSLGMQEPVLRQYIYDHITYGHAACVWIIGELWRTRGSSAFIDLSKLHALFKVDAQEAFINKHILDKHRNSSLRELIHYGVLLRSFDQPLLQAVFPEWLPEVDAFQQFHRLIRYPYVKPQNNNRYTFLNLMRDILTEYIREQEPKRWHEYQQKASSYLRYGTKDTHPDYYYYSIMRNELIGMAEWKQAVQEAYNSGRHEQLTALLEIAQDKTLKLTLASCAERAYQHGRFYTQQKQWESAYKSYQEAIALFQQAGDHIRQTQVQQALDNVQQHCSD